MIPLGFLIFLTIKFLLFHLPFKLVTLSLPPAIISCVTSVVLIKVCSAEFPQMKPLSEIDTGLSGKSVRLGWTSTPTSNRLGQSTNHTDLPPLSSTWALRPGPSSSISGDLRLPKALATASVVTPCSACPNNKDGHTLLLRISLAFVTMRMRRITGTWRGLTRLGGSSLAYAFSIRAI